MKLIIFYLNFLFLFILGKYTHHTKKKLHHRNVLTPKADDLNNHFGYHPFNSPYGPQEKKLIYVSSLEPQPVYNLCEITVQPYYDDCSQLSTCGLCATSPYCGFFHNFIILMEKIYIIYRMVSKCAIVFTWKC